jgi:hypothetical protein
LRNLFRPTLLADKIWEIVLEDLTGRGIRGLILDLDNTLVDWNESFLRPEVEVWLAKARAVGMRLCLASNAVRGGRVARVAEELGLPAVIRAGKPFPVAFRKAMAALKTEPASTCAIGDQVFTDMLGANWLGLTTVLVKPLSPKESPHTRVIRLIERPLRRRWALQLKAEMQAKDSDQRSA